MNKIQIISGMLTALERVNVSDTPISIVNIHNYEKLPEIPADFRFKKEKDWKQNNTNKNHYKTKLKKTKRR